MSDCINCKGQCTQLISDACLRYEGEAKKCLNLREGSFDDPVFYREAFDALADKFCEFLENNNVDPSCLYDRSGSTSVPVKEAVELLISKVCSLSTDDISATASSYAVGANSSICGAKLLNRGIEWSTTNYEAGIRFTYNFSNAASNLPPDYIVNNVNVKAIGKSSGSVNTIFANSDKRSGGFNITPNRLPVQVEATLNIDTPCGQVSLSKTIGLSSAQEGSFTTPLNVLDTASTTNFGGKNLTKYLEEQSSQISINKNEIDSLKDISVQGCDNVQYPFNDIHTVVQVQGAKVCESLYRLDNIGEETILLTDCDDNCGLNTYESTLQKALDRMSEIMCKNQERIAALEDRVRELELTVASCCDGTGSSSSSSGGSSGGGGGGCVGGNCPDGNFNSGGGFGGGGTITGNPNGGSGDGNGNPETCNDSPVTIDWSYNCTSGLEYTVTGAVGSFVVTVDGQVVKQGEELSDGVHVLKVVDSRNCSSSASININCCSISLTTTYGCNSGLVATVSGGSGNTQITVDGGPYTEGMLLSDGSHTVKVTDNTENCSESKIVNVSCGSTNPCDGVSIQVTTDTSSYCNDNSIVVSLSGGTGPYSIKLAGTTLATNVSGPSHTIYSSGRNGESLTLEVIDSEGCSTLTSVYIPDCVNCEISLGANSQNPYTCEAGFHELNFAVARPSGTFEVIIYDNVTGDIVSTITNQTGSQSYSYNVGVGTTTQYLILVEDSAGCTADTLITTVPCS